MPRIIQDTMIQPGPPGPPGTEGDYYTEAETDALLADKLDADTVADVENEEFAAGGFVFSDGRATATVFDRDGRPIPGAATLIAEALAAQGYVPVDVENDEQAAGGFLFADGRATFTVFDRDGKPTRASAEMISEALTEAGLVGGEGTVASINDQTGAITIAAGDNVDVATSGDTITIHAEAGGDVPLFAPLDIWAGFAASGVNEEWPNDTYAEFLAGIDAKLDGAATKTTIGTAADGTTPIYAYTAGTENRPHALVIGGTHGNEHFGIWGAMRFFTEFAINDHPVMAALRDRIQLTYIPVLNAAQYRGTRENDNGVDLNRNFPFYWDYYTSGSLFKGSTALSEPESVALKTLLDTSNIAFVMDCHAGGTTNLSYYPPSAIVPVGNGPTYAALTLWDQQYRTADTTYEAWTVNQDADPMIRNWAAKYLRFELGRHNAMTATIETNKIIGDSTENNFKRLGMRMYCGLIHLYLAAWLQNGQPPEPVMPFALTYQRTVAAPGTALGSGGSLISSTTAAPVTFDTYPGDDGGSTVLDFIDIPLRAPGSFSVEAVAVLEADATATDATRIEMAIGWAQSPPTGGDVAVITDADALAWTDVPAAGGRATLSHRWHLADTLGITDPGPLYRLQLYLRLTDGSADPVVLTSARIQVTHHPDIETDPTPTFIRSS